MNPSSNDKHFNMAMAKHIPELASPYATFPLARDRWLQPSETDAKGEPCYLAGTEQPNGFKMNYVWGRGPLGVGYYHMCTREAYVNLYGRVSSLSFGGGCCACSKKQRAQNAEQDKIRRLIYARSVASYPNDAHGEKQAAEQWGNMHGGTVVDVVKNTRL